jgi:hypothetical protein
MKWRTGILYRPEIGEAKYHAVFDDRNRIIAVTGLVGCECEPETLEHTKLIASVPEILEALEEALSEVQGFAKRTGVPQ